MDEYIKRESLLQAAKQVQGNLFDAPLIVNLIQNAPAEDVQEVRHGEWIEGAEHFTNGFYEAECNKCGNYIRWNEGNSGEWNFCPHCGAKMDGKGEV